MNSFFTEVTKSLCSIMLLIPQGNPRFFYVLLKTIVDFAMLPFGSGSEIQGKRKKGVKSKKAEDKGRMIKCGEGRNLWFTREWPRRQ